MDGQNPFGGQQRPQGFSPLGDRARMEQMARGGGSQISPGAPAARPEFLPQFNLQQMAQSPQAQRLMGAFRNSPIGAALSGLANGQMPSMPVQGAPGGMGQLPPWLMGMMGGKGA